MTGGAVLKAASGGAARRLVQSAVIFGVLTASSAAALLGLTLLTSASQGFYAGCAATRCADLAVTINSAKVTAAQLAKTQHLPGVTRAAGPYPQTTITVSSGSRAGHPSGPRTAAGRPAGHAPAPGTTPAGRSAGGGLPAQQLTVVGRASPSGPLDDIDANPSIMTSMGRSRWPARTGEISLAMSTAIRLPLGSRLRVTSAPGKPKLTIVGYADQSLNYEDAWVVPGEIPALRANVAPAREEMLYTFTHAATTAQIDADLAELRHALPGGAIASSQSWLAFAQGLGSQSNDNTPFVIAFAVLALVLGTLITANVVSAAVAASYRRIGVLKSIGFTPAQVTAAYLAQIGLPALAGAIAGTILGNKWVLPVIGIYPIAGERVYVPLWINLTVPLGMCALTGLAASIPALRAGRLPAAAAITAGQAPRAGRGYRPHRLAGRLALPRPVTIGLAAPFSRPARAAVTLAALTIGLTGVALGTSLYSSIHKINYSTLAGLGQVQASYRCGRQCTLTASQNAKILAALHAQPKTRHYVAESDLILVSPAAGHKIMSGPLVRPVPGGVAGQPGLPALIYAYGGDSSWLGWNMISGRWYHGPHEADVNSVFLAATGKTVGDPVTLRLNGKRVTMRIADQVFTPIGLPPCSPAPRPSSPPPAWPSATTTSRSSQEPASRPTLAR
jgi:putative ABC transport system permease protein